MRLDATVALANNGMRPTPLRVAADAERDEGWAR
jgi:hypothetical protein